MKNKNKIPLFCKIRNFLTFSSPSLSMINGNCGHSLRNQCKYCPLCYKSPEKVGKDGTTK